MIDLVPIKRPIPSSTLFFYAPIVHTHLYASLSSKYQIAWYDWIIFIVTHVVRGVDVFDFIEEYQLMAAASVINPIWHVSVYAGTMIVAMHWLVDIFFISFVVYFIRKNLYTDAAIEAQSQKPQKKARSIGCFGIFFFGIYILSAGIQGWRAKDIFILWPVDNIIRLLDIGDMFHVYDWRLHQVEQGFWNAWH